jgi:hypothetical protein
MTDVPSPPKKSVLDSPWYWLYVFSAAALAALFLAGPRYAQRQAQLERNYQARQRAVQHRVGEAPSTPLSEPSRTHIPLWPLFGVLSVLLLIAWWKLGRRQPGGPLATEPEPSPHGVTPTPPPDHVPS